MPWQKEVEDGFEGYFKAEGPKPEVFFEYIDAGRFGSASQLEVFRDYIAGKYASRRIDYVIYESRAAASFLRAYPEMFGGSYKIALNPGPDSESLSNGSTVIAVRADYQGAARELLSIPGLETVYVVAGATEDGRERVSEFVESLSRVDPDRRAVPLVGLPMEDLLERVEGLERRSVVFYLLYFKDGHGARYIPYEVAARVSERASVPVYSLWTSLLGSGIVGGYMLSGEMVGREAAKLLTEPELLEKAGQLDLTDEFHGNFYDWRALRRWYVDTGGLPPGSRIMFREPHFLEQYYREIGAFAVLFMLVLLYARNRELRAYNRKLDAARLDLQDANEQLERHRESLEEMVKERTGQLNERNVELRAALDRAHDLDRLKDQFMANLSHELRTPMNGVLGMSEALLRSGLSEEQNEQVEAMRASAGALLAILNDLLDFSMISSDRLELSYGQFSPAEVVRSSLDMFMLTARGKGIRLESRIDPGVPSLLVGDGVRLRQVLVNLTGNAVKFTSEGYVRVNAVVEDRGEGTVRLGLSVEDTGIGIPGTELGRIFDSFSQADGSRSRSFGGAGLGLAIASGIARLMGGGAHCGERAREGERIQPESLFRPPRGARTRGDGDCPCI